MVKRLPVNSMIVPLIVACSLFMQNLDTSIINTALPSIALSFGDSPVRLSLAVTAYMLSLAVFIPVSGWIADRYGAATVFRAAIAVFTIASIACGFCNNIVELTSARILQGVGGAMMVPVGRLVLLRSIDRTELVRAISYLTTPAILGPIMGPPVGGLITTYLSWRWVFFLNVPFGILGIVLVTLLIEDTKPDHVPPLDWRGFVLTGVTLTCLMSGCNLIAHPAVSDGIVLAIFAVGTLTGGAAFLHARRHVAPLIDLTLMRIATFRANITGGSIFRVTVGAMPFLMPMMLQVGFGMSAFNSGLITFAGGLGSFFNKMSTGPILRRFGYRTTFVVNCLISAGFFALCALFTQSTPVLLMFAILAVGGFFRSLQFTALNSLAFVDIPSGQMSAATSFSSMVQQLTNGMGIALAAIAVHLTHVARASAEAPLSATDFRIAFVVFGVFSLFSIASFRKLEPAAGAAVTGHRPSARGGQLEETPAE
ncbi:MAG TPA: MFS transporter [Stellaceae bacterium]|nr:MFS transporter [Stellaceae bacterium]